MNTAKHYLERVRAARDAGELDKALFSAAACMAAADEEPDHDSGCNVRASIARIYMSRENFSEALRWWRDRLEYAKGHGLTLQMAMGAHELAVCYDDMGERRLAVQAYGLALELYPTRSRRLSALIADKSRYDSDGPCFMVQAWRAYGQDAVEPRDRLFALANVAEAAADCSLHAFDRAWPLLMAEVKQVADGEGLARVLVSAAAAAERRGRHEDAETLLENAVRVAERRGEDAVRERAEAFLASARSFV